MGKLGFAHESAHLAPGIRILVLSDDTRPAGWDLPDRARFLRRPYTPGQITASIRQLMA